MPLHGIKRAHYLLILAGWCCLSSCHYQFGQSELSQQYATLSVPYAEGDREGELTAEVIRKLSQSGAFRYVSTGGNLLLKIKLLEVRDENIDFGYDRKKRGSHKKSIVPKETRCTAVAEIRLIEAGTGKTIRGPVQVSANTEFDHTYYAVRNEINVFSLSQLSDIDAAEHAAMHPLNRHLAEKIADYVINGW